MLAKSEYFRYYLIYYLKGSSEKSRLKARKAMPEKDREDNIAFMGLLEEFVYEFLVGPTMFIFDTLHNFKAH